MVRKKKAAMKVIGGKHYVKGVIPVELWRDEQLDAFLNTHFDTWDLQMRRELHTNEPVYFIEGKLWITNLPCTETSRGAKIAAVIAVAESEGK